MAYPFATFEKDPDATLDYLIDWSAWLGVDTIATATWTVQTAGITVNSSSKTNTTTTVWIAGGSAGQNYDVTCRVTTAGGRTDDRTLRFQVRAR